MDEFLDDFMAMLKKLKQNDFIAKVQASFVQELKKTLKHGEFLISQKIILVLCKMPSNRIIGIHHRQQCIHLCAIIVTQQMQSF